MFPLAPSAISTSMWYTEYGDTMNVSARCNSFSSYISWRANISIEFEMAGSHFRSFLMSSRSENRDPEVKLGGRRVTFGGGLFLTGGLGVKSGSLSSSPLLAVSSSRLEV